ncbi:hypothetical protein [Mycolicibacterium gilvum]|uniref:Uncharacterized protein n=1 Tax=Mycolicibacterium gilvum TaxID=1804 RepID=A0A378SIB1_9MYCO|nr:hypothetical protein [Mycolicibacterium gilvum]STZ42440.1 Uncharacterised protein [Mycolicibacterium gilvum]
MNSQAQHSEIRRWKTPAPSIFDRLPDGVYGLITVNLFARCVAG